MERVTIDEAVQHLAHLIDEAARGLEVVIAKDDKTQVRLVPVRAPRPQRREPGSARGLVTIPDDFDAPVEGFEE